MFYYDHKSQITNGIQTLVMQLIMIMKVTLSDILMREK